MDQENTMDFRALRAKFQDEELLLKQPRIKPALPEKPKVVPPPQSPTHYLPAGARPSLLTSINSSLEGKTMMAPRVIFKDEMKDSKKPLIQINSRGKEKSEAKLKGSKDKTKGVKEKLEDEASGQKRKKENGKGTAELVPATPPPKAATPKKKNFLTFKRSLKKDAAGVPADPILDTPSSHVPGPAPLIPVPSAFGDAAPQPQISAPKALMPNIPIIPDSRAAVEIPPPSIIPAFPDFTPPPAFIPDNPAAKVPSPESETPLETETPALSVSRPASQNEITPSPPSVAPTPPPRHSVCTPPPAASTPEPEAEAVIVAAAEKPPPRVTDPPSVPPSPKPERPISALSALERAEDMTPGKRPSPADQRILNALEKARRKTASPTASYSITPPPEELPPPHSPTQSFPQLPPIDYEARAGNSRSAKPEQVNGIDHGQASPVLGGISEEGSDVLPEVLVVPRPPPKKVFPDRKSLGPPPPKPTRPLSVNLSDFSPPAVEDEEILARPDLSETDTTDLPEFDDAAPDAPELQVSEWGNEEYAGSDTADGRNLSLIYSNGVAAAGAELQAAPGLGDEYQDHLPPESSFPVSQESPSVAGPEAEVSNGTYESTENVYEDISMSASKKKVKTDGGKKRKGPPKNPYAEAAQEASEEKSRAGRFSRIDKKAATEGPDEKELKKKEKQRLEKEKKELKEKQEREKKEQKEREKKRTR
ncbi:uncharacterized protein LOC130170470 [Seriola aureovittata]|uniref:uncharacterized protein LOC130170470 n=1 Tax=Seriola aureovittata TaxID=2871759 RepID=UPI0024BF0A26|nr:uncharacterized protein LOC130170470 [Seriola aureovittata]